MSDETNAEAAVGCLVRLILTPFTTALRGWVLTKLWAWFIVPVFELPMLTLGYAIGLSLLVSFLTLSTNDCKQEKRTTTEWTVNSIATSVSLSLFALAFGWVVMKAQGR